MIKIDHKQAPSGHRPLKRTQNAYNFHPLYTAPVENGSSFFRKAVLIGRFIAYGWHGEEWTVRTHSPPWCILYGWFPGPHQWRDLWELLSRIQNQSDSIILSAVGPLRYQLIFYESIHSRDGSPTWCPLWWVSRALYHLPRGPIVGRYKFNTGKCLFCQKNISYSIQFPSFRLFSLQFRNFAFIWIQHCPSEHQLDVS